MEMYQQLFRKQPVVIQSLNYKYLYAKKPQNNDLQFQSHLPLMFRDCYWGVKGGGGYGLTGRS